MCVPTEELRCERGRIPGTKRSPEFSRISRFSENEAAVTKAKLRFVPETRGEGKQQILVDDDATDHAVAAIPRLQQEHE